MQGLGRQAGLRRWELDEGEKAALEAIGAGVDGGVKVQGVPDVSDEAASLA